MTAVEVVMAVLMAAIACACGACAFQLVGDVPAARSARGSLARWRHTIAAVSHDGGVGLGDVRRRLWLTGSAVGALCGFSLLGIPGAALGAFAAICRKARPQIAPRTLRCPDRRLRCGVRAGARVGAGRRQLGAGRSIGIRAGYAGAARS